MIACLDVQYRNGYANAAMVVFNDWHSGSAAAQFTHRDVCTAEYEPGNFYKRELPLLLAVLKKAAPLPDIIVVDGYVWLHRQGEDSRPGLGAHLHVALEGKAQIIGVAKKEFAGSDSVKVLRGNSARALLVTAAGIDVIVAAEFIRTMHGDFRLPTMIKAADSLARSM